uniref:Uncharacterized protein n=1 Tax=Arundo donax TaxID=35708 RepID=A0A0A9AKW7_ARUDO
MSPEGSGRRQG